MPQARREIQAQRRDAGTLQYPLLAWVGRGTVSLDARCAEDSLVLGIFQD